MGGMGFGKRAYGFDEPIEFYPDTDENGEDLFYPVYPDQEEEDGGEAEKRATGEKPEDWNPEEKRGISSLKGKVRDEGADIRFSFVTGKTILL